VIARLPGLGFDWMGRSAIVSGNGETGSFEAVYTYTCIYVSCIHGGQCLDNYVRRKHSCNPMFLDVSGVRIANFVSFRQDF
jgi:hypothetical protein